MRPFRFLAEPGDVADGKALVEAARRAESIGYDVMVYPDHVVIPFGLVPLLTTVAAVTERLRVAAFVINNDLRHPALVAQDMASLDVISGGRRGGRARRRLEPAGVRRARDLLRPGRRPGRAASPRRSR